VDFSYPTDTEQFRRSFRSWLRANLTEDVLKAGRHLGADADAFERLRSWNLAFIIVVALVVR